MFRCLVVGHEGVKCKMKVRKLGRGVEKEVKKKRKRLQKMCDDIGGNSWLSMLLMFTTRCLSIT